MTPTLKDVENGFVHREDIAAVNAIPQEAIDLAALKAIFFNADSHGFYPHGDFSEELADEYGIYGSDRSNGSTLRVLVALRVRNAIRKFLDRPD
jgi:hypothetical protein